MASTDLERRIVELEQENQQLRSAAALPESVQEWMRQTLERIPWMMAAFDDQGRVVLWNDECARVTGYSSEDVVGQPDALQRLLPRADAHMALLGECRERGGDYRGREIVIRCKDGSQRTLEWTSISRHLPFAGWATWGVGVDVTRTRSLHASLAQADRLASIGVLAGGVVHEINNPLTYVLFHLESLSLDLPRVAQAVRGCRSALSEHLGGERALQALGAAEPASRGDFLDDVVQRVDEARLGVQRIRNVVRDLRVLSRVDGNQLSLTSLNTVIESAITIAQNEIKYRARLVKDLGSLPAITANDGRLLQVLIDLLIHAAHGIDEGAVEQNEIRIRTWADGDHVYAEIRDTGRGMAPDDVERIFDTLSSTPYGSGLGLGISQSIISGLGGQIRVESEPGQGARFVVQLPVNNASQTADAEGAAAARRRRPTPVRGGRILVVDDESLVGRAVSRMLEPDYQVQLARSGQEAQELLARDQEFDAVLCDLVMPAVTGMDLHQWVSQRVPALAARMVFLTGGAFTPAARAFVGSVPNIVLEKPVDRQALRGIVAQVVAGRRPGGS